MLKIKNEDIMRNPLSIILFVAHSITVNDTNGNDETLCKKKTVALLKGHKKYIELIETYVMYYQSIKMNKVFCTEPVFL
jgi:hypothetical protein